MIQGSAAQQMPDVTIPHIGQWVVFAKDTRDGALAEGIATGVSSPSHDGHVAVKVDGEWRHFVAFPLSAAPDPPVTPEADDAK